MNTAVVSLIIFGLCVALFIWNKLPHSLVALLGLCAMILSGACSFAEGFKHFSGSIVLLICSMMVVGQATFDTGLAKVVGDKAIALARGNERLLIIITTLLTGIVSSMLSNVATLAIVTSMLISVSASDKNIHFKNLMMPAALASVMGGAITLVGSTPQLTGQAILETFVGEGNGFTFTTFMLPGSLCLLALALYAGFIGYPLGKRIWGNAPDYNTPPVDNTAADDGPKCKNKLSTMAVIFAATVVLFVATDPIKKVIPNFNIGLVSLMAALACVLTGCISHKDAFKSVDWSLAVWFCACMGVAEGLTISGGSKMMADWLIGMLGDNISPMTLYAAFCVFVAVVKQFLNNSTTVTIALPVALPLAIELGYNPFPLAVGIVMLASVSSATPLSNTTMAMGMVANYSFKDYVKYCLPISLVTVLIVIFMVPMLWPLA